MCILYIGDMHIYIYTYKYIYIVYVCPPYSHRSIEIFFRNVFIYTYIYISCACKYVSPCQVDPPPKISKLIFLGAAVYV